MKHQRMKHIPYLAVLGLFGLAAHTAAQSSSVTLFGRIDVSVAHQSSDTFRSQTRMLDIYGPASLWGLRGSEDLGNGLKANFILEAGFQSNSGEGDRMFGRQSWLGLSSDRFGELRMGRQYILHEEVQSTFNATGWGRTALNHAAMFTVPTGTFVPILGAPRIDNAVQYLSPTFHGLKVQAMTAFSQGGAQDRYQGFKASYANGNLIMGAAYEQSKTRTLPLSGKSTVNKIVVGGASYNFGVVKVHGLYERGKNLTMGAGTQLGTLNLPGLSNPATDLKAYAVGVSVPMGATRWISLYVRSRFSEALSGARTNATIARYGFGAIHALSPRTSLYSVAVRAGGSLKRSVAEKRTFQVGAFHEF